MNFAYSILVTLVWFLSTYFIVVLLLILLTERDKIQRSPCRYASCELPRVSIIVPAYNEQNTITESIESLRKLDYPHDKLEVIIVNDGSRDRTSEIVRRVLPKGFIFIDNTQNKGKAICLNQGIQRSTGEFVATMDADSEVSANVLQEALPFFQDKKVGAVTVSVEVKNPSTLLDKIISVEYIIGLSLSLKALSLFNAIHVTPGPFSIYRREAFNKIGLFDHTNMTEDLEIAYRLQRHHYRIENCLTTKVWTVIPRTLKELYVQRKRWYTGALLTLSQHRDLVINPSMGAFGITMPYTFMLVFLGMAVFFYSVVLLASNIFRMISFYYFTNFNFFSHIRLLDFDVLSFGGLSILGASSVLATVVCTVVCMKIAQKQARKHVSGAFGFMFLFFLYQIFWASSVYAALFGRKVKWR